MHACGHTDTYMYMHKYHIYLFMGIMYFKRSKNCSRMFQYLLNVTFCLYMAYQFSIAVLVFCSSKLSQTLQLNTAEIYFVIVLEAGSQKSRCPQGGLLREALRQNQIHSSLPAPWLSAVLGTQMRRSNPCLSSHGLPLCLLPFRLQ